MHGGSKLTNSLCREYRTSSLGGLKILELSRHSSNLCVENVPGDSVRLAENFCGLLGIAACFVAKAPASRIDLEATLHDHRPGNQDVMRRGDRALTLVGAEIRKLGAEGFAPNNRIAAIAGMTEIKRVRHLRYEAANQLGIAPVTAAREDQSLAADALANAVAPHDLNAAHTPISVGKQPLRDAFGQDHDP